MNDKLILICSDVSEPSTDIVCSWLNYYDKKFVRVSAENIIDIKSIVIKDNYIDINFNIDNEGYKLSDFKSYWYRRSRLKFAIFSEVKFLYNGKDISSKMNVFLEKEYNKVVEFFEMKLNQLAILNKFKDNNINKLQVLSLANDLGIKVPETYVLNDFSMLDFSNEGYITKAISDLAIIDNDTTFYSMTQRVNYDDGKNIWYSLIQKEVQKKFEIRSFYFNNRFFSSAIFSQENDKTKLDFRNYDFENPNRVVPFKFPISLEEKISKLCNKLDLKSGSFDFAYTNEGEYVLFEVNPVGQFEQVSAPCNYNIHKEIAVSL
ncbi:MULTISPECIES: grasp-with-spasm system ATP-grasp peptide maturase [Flavobacterium]|uniref:grasp-with-spasm system ATP-grasp peptide maturase n=1 Tax=Flavobacterium TaxID=237 RepID=UPI001FCB9D4C|nr:MULTISPECIES: grasp-with-spasm system ATP-grasp peptide maturase [Flavobacterium]UOK43465.1 grasp-with-spasm system ATP-grasp peptide maturase [Flavobacterium enshiense]